MKATHVRVLAHDEGIDLVDKSETSGSAPPPVQPLPVGTRLHDYEIRGVLGRSEAGLVYLASDPSHHDVAIKELLPKDLATRDATSRRVVALPYQRDKFKASRRRFLAEARLLSATESPALVKVIDAFEHQGTAYAVMPGFAAPPYEGAQTLSQALDDLGRSLSEEEVLLFALPLLDGLSVMHSAGCLHCNIAPDAILLHEGRPVLLPFFERHEPLFAPLEQCVTGSSMKQGAWTDLYSLAAVMHAAVSGRAPVSSVQRRAGVFDEPLSVTEFGRLSDGFLAAVAKGLELRPEARPQSAQEFRQLLVGDPVNEPPLQPAAAEPVKAAKPVKPTKPVKSSEPAGQVASKGSSRKGILTAVLVGLIVAGGALLAWNTLRQGDEGIALASDEAPSASGEGKEAFPTKESLAKSAQAALGNKVDAVPAAMPAPVSVAGPAGGAVATAASTSAPAGAARSVHPAAPVTMPEASIKAVSRSKLKRRPDGSTAPATSVEAEPMLVLRRIPGKNSNGVPKRLVPLVGYR